MKYIEKCPECEEFIPREEFEEHKRNHELAPWENTERELIQ